MKTLILGSPGTGKTETILTLLEGFLKTNPIQKIAYVSFTKSAVQSAVSRCLKKFPSLAEKDFIYFKTLHALCFHLLGFKSNQVLTEERKKIFSDIMNIHGETVSIDFNENSITDNRCIPLYLYHLARNNLFSPYEAALKYNTDVTNTDVDYIIECYESYKKHQGLIDFNDMLDYEKIQPIDTDIVFCDEAQDFTLLQWKVFHKIFSKAKHVYICGDDDQAVFEWCGSDNGYLLREKSFFDDIRILSETYRLPKNILEKSLSFIQPVQDRFYKNVHSKKENGVIQEIADIELLDDIILSSLQKNESWFLLSRTNYKTEYFKNYLFSSGFPFELNGKKYCSVKTLYAIFLYFFYRTQQTVLTEVQRKFLNKYFNRLDTNYWYINIRATGEETAYYRRVLQKKAADYKKERAALVSTIHRVKGLEAQNVVILPDMTNKICTARDKNPDSEIRVFYTAFTRSSRNLYLLTPQSIFY